MGLVVLIWALVPIVLESALLKTFTARYLLLAVPPLLVIGGFGASELFKKIPSRLAVLGLLLLLLPIYYDYLIIAKPADAHLPRNERRGYLEEWTAGYGFSEIAKFLIDQKKQGPVVVGTEGYFGTLPDGLYIYLDRSSITVMGGPATISAELKEAAKSNITYYVGNKNRLYEHMDGVKLLKEYPKAKPRDNRSQDAIVLYKVLP